MSNYRAPAFHPEKCRVEEADWLDDQFELHTYGVRFDGEDRVFRASDCGLQGAVATISRITAERGGLAADLHKVQCELDIASAALNEIVTAIPANQGGTQGAIRKRALIGLGTNTLPDADRG